MEFFAFILQQIVINLIISDLPAGLTGDKYSQNKSLHGGKGKGGEDFGQSPEILNEESS